MSLAFNKIKSRLRILVLGYIVRGPMGGMTWHHLQYFLGLHQMGHDVYFLEDSGDSEYCCYDPQRDVTDNKPAYGLNYAQEVFKRVGLERRWAYYDYHTQNWLGPLSGRAPEIISGADMLLNLSCSNPLRQWFLKVPIRVLVDTDPVFTQIRNLTDPQRKELAAKHNFFFTFGENFGSHDCNIPDDGFPWKPTRQPIVLNAWPVLEGNRNGAFTTVMKWESYPGQYYDGRYFGMKADSFSDYLEIPAKSCEKLEMALSDKSAPRGLLLEKGWFITHPYLVSDDPWKYQNYIRQSKGEFSLSKQGYVIGKTGWFSERSAAYLASGRPVLVQDTCFSKWMETGRGVLSFRNSEEVVEGLKFIDMDYRLHCQSARKLAESYFDSGDVLGNLIQLAIDQDPNSVNNIYAEQRKD